MRSLNDGSSLVSDNFFSGNKFFLSPWGKVKFAKSELFYLRIYRAIKNQDVILITAEFIATRNVLWYVVFLGFAVNYMIRININIAIVAMVRRPQKSENVKVSECFIHPNETSDLLLTNSTTFPDVINKTLEKEVCLSAKFATA